MAAFGRFLPVLTGCNESRAASGLGIRITNRSEHYRPVDQFDAQGITQTYVYCCKDIRWEIDDDVSATITWILALHECPHGLSHKGKSLDRWEGPILRPHGPY
ncbi:unnamed protein product, partial [Mesorhabditis spiculigera]